MLLRYFSYLIMEGNFNGIRGFQNFRGFIWFIGRFVAENDFFICFEYLRGGHLSIVSRIFKNYFFLFSKAITITISRDLFIFSFIVFLLNRYSRFSWLDLELFKELRYFYSKVFLHLFLI